MSYMNEIFDTMSQEAGIIKMEVLKDTIERVMEVLHKNREERISISEIEPQCIPIFKMAMESGSQKLFYEALAGYQIILSSRQDQSEDDPYHTQLEYELQWQILSGILSAVHIPDECITTIIKIILHIWNIQKYLANQKIMSLTFEICLNCYMWSEREINRAACLATISHILHTICAKYNSLMKSQSLNAIKNDHQNKDFSAITEEKVKSIKNSIEGNVLLIIGMMADQLNPCDRKFQYIRCKMILTSLLDLLKVVPKLIEKNYKFLDLISKRLLPSMLQFFRSCIKQNVFGRNADDIFDYYNEIPHNAVNNQEYDENPRDTERPLNDLLDLFNNLFRQLWDLESLVRSDVKGKFNEILFCYFDIDDSVSFHASIVFLFHLFDDYKMFTTIVTHHTYSFGGRTLTLNSYVLLRLFQKCMDTYIRAESSVKRISILKCLCAILHSMHQTFLGDKSEMWTSNCQYTYSSSESYESDDDDDVETLQKTHNNYHTSDFPSKSNIIFNLQESTIPRGSANHLRTKSWEVNDDGIVFSQNPQRTLSQNDISESSSLIKKQKVFTDARKSSLRRFKKFLNIYNIYESSSEKPSQRTPLIASQQNKDSPSTPIIRWDIKKSPTIQKKNSKFHRNLLDKETEKIREKNLRFVVCIESAIKRMRDYFKSEQFITETGIDHEYSEMSKFKEFRSFIQSKVTNSSCLDVYLLVRAIFIVLKRNFDGMSFNNLLKSSDSNRLNNSFFEYLRLVENSFKDVLDENFIQIKEPFRDLYDNEAFYQHIQQIEDVVLSRERIRNETLISLEKTVCDKLKKVMGMVSTIIHQIMEDGEKDSFQTASDYMQEIKFRIYIRCLLAKISVCLGMWTNVDKALKEMHKFVMKNEQSGEESGDDICIIRLQIYKVAVFAATTSITKNVRLLSTWPQMFNIISDLLKRESKFALMNPLESPELKSFNVTDDFFGNAFVNHKLPEEAYALASELDVSIESFIRNSRLVDLLWFFQILMLEIKTQCQASYDLNLNSDASNNSFVCIAHLLIYIRTLFRILHMNKQLTLFHIFAFLDPFNFCIEAAIYKNVNANLQWTVSNCIFDIFQTILQFFYMESVELKLSECFIKKVLIDQVRSVEFKALMTSCIFSLLRESFDLRSGKHLLVDMLHFTFQKWIGSERSHLGADDKLYDTTSYSSVFTLFCNKIDEPWTPNIIIHFTRCVQLYCMVSSYANQDISANPILLRLEDDLKTVMMKLFRTLHALSAECSDKTKDYDYFIIPNDRGSFWPCISQPHVGAENSALPSEFINSICVRATKEDFSRFSRILYRIGFEISDLILFSYEINSITVMISWLNTIIEMMVNYKVRFLFIHNVLIPLLEFLITIEFWTSNANFMMNLERLVFIVLDNVMYLFKNCTPDQENLQILLECSQKLFDVLQLFLTSENSTFCWIAVKNLRELMKYIITHSVFVNTQILPTVLKIYCSMFSQSVSLNYQKLNYLFACYSPGCYNVQGDREYVIKVNYKDLKPSSTKQMKSSDFLQLCMVNLQGNGEFSERLSSDSTNECMFKECLILVASKDVPSSIVYRIPLSRLIVGIGINRELLNLTSEIFRCIEQDLFCNELKVSPSTEQIVKKGDGTPVSSSVPSGSPPSYEETTLRMNNELEESYHQIIKTYQYLWRTCLEFDCRPGLKYLLKTLCNLPCLASMISTCTIAFTCHFLGNSTMINQLRIQTKQVSSTGRLKIQRKSTNNSTHQSSISSPNSLIGNKISSSYKSYTKRVSKDLNSMKYQKCSHQLLDLSNVSNKMALNDYIASLTEICECMKDIVRALNCNSEDSLSGSHNSLEAVAVLEQLNMFSEKKSIESYLQFKLKAKPSKVDLSAKREYSSQQEINPKDKEKWAAIVKGLELAANYKVEENSYAWNTSLGSNDLWNQERFLDLAFWKHVTKDLLSYLRLQSHESLKCLMPPIFKPLSELISNMKDEKIQKLLADIIMQCGKAFGVSI